MNSQAKDPWARNKEEFVRGVEYYYKERFSLYERFVIWLKVVVGGKVRVGGEVITRYQLNSEISAIEGRMGSKAARDSYFADEIVQSRYRDLIVARERAQTRLQKFIYWIKK